MGPATHLANRFKRGDLGINLDFLKARFKFLLLRWFFGKRTASFLAGGVMGRGEGCRKGYPIRERFILGPQFSGNFIQAMRGESLAWQ